MIVSLEDFKKYVNKQHTTEFDEVMTDILEAAQGYVSEYIGYNPEQADYANHILDGDGSYSLILKAHPITSVTEFILDDVDITADIKIRDDGNYISTYPHELTDGYSNIDVTYTAGYAAGEEPEILVNTIIRIAGVLYNEREHTGVNSVSDAITGSRTFNQISLLPYLRNLDGMRR